MTYVNNRVFWAVQAVGLAKLGSHSYTAIHGLQSVGINTTFNLEQVFELGQIAIYENIENIPDVEVTLEKVLDGYPLIYHLATPNATSATLVGRSNTRCNAAMAIFADNQDSASGVPLTEVLMSGMYVSSLTYTFPVEGNCTEAVTLVGNDKRWRSASYKFADTTDCDFDNTDVPAATTLGGVQRRENVVFANSLMPEDIPNMTAGGVMVKTDDVYPAHIQSITVSTDLGRDEINELGRKGPYHRYATFPTEVTCEIEVIAQTGDQITAHENSTLTARAIKIALEDTTLVDLGDSCKLANTAYGGGDAGGGNATVTYSYSTFNELTVTQDSDPAGL